MTRRRWSVVIESRHCAFVSGYGTREELTTMRGRAPMWSSAAKAWCTTEDTARDLIARGERRGIQVDVESYVVLHPTTVAKATVEQPDPGRGLW